MLRFDAGQRPTVQDLLEEPFLTPLVQAASLEAARANPDWVLPALADRVMGGARAELWREGDARGKPSPAPARPVLVKAVQQVCQPPVPAFSGSSRPAAAKAAVHTRRGLAAATTATVVVQARQPAVVCKAVAPKARQPPVPAVSGGKWPAAAKAVVHTRRGPAAATTATVVVQARQPAVVGQAVPQKALQPPAKPAFATAGKAPARQVPRGGVAAPAPVPTTADMEHSASVSIVESLGTLSLASLGGSGGVLSTSSSDDGCSAGERDSDTRPVADQSQGQHRQPVVTKAAAGGTGAPPSKIPRLFHCNGDAKPTTATGMPGGSV